MIDQIKQQKSEIQSNYDDMKLELNKVIDSSDNEKDKLQHQIKELKIRLDAEKQKSGSLYDVTNLNFTF